MAHSILKKIIYNTHEIRTDYADVTWNKRYQIYKREIKHKLDSVCLLIDSEIKQRV